jgi:hypothetical protein
MTAEVDPVLGDSTQFGKGEDLKSAAIGQDRVFPAHEPVESAKMFYHVESRTEKQVIRVPEYDLCVEGSEFLGAYRLDASLRTDRHENGCFNKSMPGNQPASARQGIRVGFKKLERHRGTETNSGAGSTDSR